MPNLKEIAYSYGIKYIKISKNNLQLLNNLLISDEKILIDIELIENEKLWPKVAAFQEEMVICPQCLLKI